MKILYVITGLKIGGAEQLLYLTCKYLLKNYNVTITVVYFDPDAPLLSKFRNLSLTVFHYKYNLYSIITLIRLILREKFDIVHTHLIFADITGRIAALVTRFWLPVKLFSTAHGTEWFRFEKNLFSKIIRMIDRFLTLFENSTVIAISKTVQEMLIRNENIKPDKIKVLYNAIEIKNVNPVEKKSRRSDSLQCLYMGRITREKNLKCLIQAINILKSAPLYLSIVGDGPCKDQLKAYVAKLGLGKKIQFFNSQLQVDSIYQSHDVFVLPSLREGLGMVILEAFAHKLLVIGSDVQGIKEIISAKRGFLFKSNNPQSLAERVYEVCQDKTRAKKIADNGFEYVKKNHDIKNYINKLYKLYL